MNEPSARHQRLAFWIAHTLANWIGDDPARGEAGIGIDWTVGDRDVLVPDAWWTRPERQLARDAVRAYEYPDLAVEVRSPSTWRHDRGRKRDVYEANGVLELWLVDGDSDTVIVDRRSRPGAPTFDVRIELRAGDVLASPLFPGLEIAVADLFDR